MAESGARVARRVIVVEGNCILGARSYILGELPVVRRQDEPEAPVSPEESPPSAERACEHIRR
jgi:hypothetical protein